MEDDVIPILLEDLGKRYSTENSKYKIAFGRYKCPYCNGEFITAKYRVTSGNTKSCGCLRNARIKEACTTHGVSCHPLYKTWKSMKSRCVNINDNAYFNYGARGIQVCDRWLDVRNFIEDMYPSYVEGLSLDRVDVDGNYEPDNCRWADKETQQRNTRDKQINNKSGYRGVSWSKIASKYTARIIVNYKVIHLGYYQTALEAAKAYERYVRLNNLKHNFTPALTEEEIKGLQI